MWLEKFASNATWTTFDRSNLCSSLVYFLWNWNHLDSSGSCSMEGSSPLFLTVFLWSSSGVSFLPFAPPSSFVCNVNFLPFFDLDFF